MIIQPRQTGPDQTGTTGRSDLQPGFDRHQAAGEGFPRQDLLLRGRFSSVPHLTPSVRVISSRSERDRADRLLWRRKRRSYSQGSAATLGRKLLLACGQRLCQRGGGGRELQALAQVSINTWFHLQAGNLIGLPSGDSAPF